MFGDLFADDTLGFETTNDTISHGLNCASKLVTPEQERNKSNFVGLYNQGATCFLNSSLQILYMTPKFRNIIFSLQLCKNKLDEISDFLPKTQKYDILLSLQKLFSQLNILNINAIKTKELTEAFKWNNNEGNEQQDSQEFIRLLLFDILERILIGTVFDNIINSIYKISFMSFMKCNNCNNIVKKNEDEYVLSLQVYQIKGLKESLYSSFGHEEIIEDYKCEKCNQKVNLIKWNKIVSLPTYINIGLNRFTFNYETFERMKVTTRFEFPLEINMKEYYDLEGNESLNDEDFIYELYGVIVHSGTPYAGHYFSYIRDMTGQGKWDYQPNEKKEEEKKEEEKKEEEKKEEEKKEEEKKEEKNKEEEKKEEEKKEEENKENENKEEEKKENENSKQSKKGKKNKNKNKNNPQNQNTQNTKKANKKNKKNQKEEKEKKEKEKEDEEERNYTKFDNKPYPIKYNNKSLGENWYEFNDSIVTPIPLGRLQKSFKGRASAYMLFYVKAKQDEKIEVLNPPDYLLNYVNELNLKLENDRKNYEIEVNSFIIDVYDEKNFMFNNENNIVFIESDDEKLVKEIKLKFNDKLNELFKDKDDNSVLYLFSYDIQNKFLTVNKKLTIEMKDSSFNDLGFFHKCKVVFSKSDSEIFNIDKIKIGKEYEPILLKMYFNGKKFEYITYSNDNIPQLKDKLSKKIGIKAEDFELSFLGNNGKDIYLDENIIEDKKTKELKSIKDLHLQNKTLISITLKKDVTLDNNNIEIKSENENEINLIVKYEDEEEIKIIKINLNKTFKDLYLLLENEYKINKNEDENNFSFRILIETNNKIITKNKFEEKLNSSPIFCEGDVRLKIEIGEIYKDDEISLMILMKDSFNQTISKEFICNPEIITINKMKLFFIKILSEINQSKSESNESEYQIYKVDAFNEPLKAIKNENLTISKSSIKDHEYLWLKNIKEIPNEIAFINIYKSPYDENYFDLFDNFISINLDDKNNIIELTLPKKTTIDELKDNINKDIDKGNMRLRLIGKYNQPERILKEKSNLKKYNVESPVNILYENLKNKEEINEHQLFLIFMLRNIKEKKYYNKTIKIINFDKNTFDSQILYLHCREFSNWKNITVSKYIRGMYNYEIIKEYDEKGKPINLKKGQFTLRDSDWIAIRNDDEEESEKDNFMTEFDIKENENLEKTNKILTTQNKKGKNRSIEKPLRINLDD